mmetsp:Transcript_13620/g.25574  ORF Transcript_13620/g.25574 Transcript_13620/m.25574 type:complete len:284 (+) Transcript_13620:3855-4706(+)|eukprot:CAMPEP_0176488710 /NCGR_PEP_ID=MMETSP0200_2-20121128/6866_1 /TAXON_ID=947934 /ORGANISM="Chaetoceros sp., Strain GSL56" /LENGTH=283 /DNA_ID=CAMNT_0017885735 /DNA_START=134 /DNA_END=985 /DNA_ORIENTATION=-
MKLFKNFALAFISTATIGSMSMLLPTSYAEPASAKDAYHVTPDQKAEIRAKVQPIIDKYFKNLSATDNVAGDKVHRDMLMDRGLKISQQCFDELTTSPFPIAMQPDIFGNEDFLINDNPVWTTYLLISLLFFPPDAIPNGFCVADKHDKISCNAALFPSVLSELFNIPGSITNFLLDVPLDTCKEAGGTLVHTSFTTDCLLSFYSTDYTRVDFFGIPQCVPESCKFKEANHFWKERIKVDFEELGFPIDECRIKFKVDTKLSKKSKNKKSSKSHKGNRKLIRN